MQSTIVTMPGDMSTAYASSQNEKFASCQFSQTLLGIEG